MSERDERLLEELESALAPLPAEPSSIEIAGLRRAVASRFDPALLPRRRARSHRPVYLLAAALILGSTGSALALTGGLRAPIRHLARVVGLPVETEEPAPRPPAPLPPRPRAIAAPLPEPKAPVAPLPEPKASAPKVSAPKPKAPEKKAREKPSLESLDKDIERLIELEMLEALAEEEEAIGREKRKIKERARELEQRAREIERKAREIEKRLEERSPPREEDEEIDPEL